MSAELTLVSQTLLNILALIVLGSVMFGTVGIFRGGEDALVIATIAPIVLLLGVIGAPALLRRGKPSRFVRVQRALAVARGAMVQVRSGLQVFRRPRLGTWATVMQLSAWAIQWLACYILLVALGLDGQAGVGAAAAVLFAVNVTAALPATPSNLGVFQAACVAVLAVKLLLVDMSNTRMEHDLRRLNQRLALYEAMRETPPGAAPEKPAGSA